MNKRSRNQKFSMMFPTLCSKLPVALSLGPCIRNDLYQVKNTYAHCCICCSFIKKKGVLAVVANSYCMFPTLRFVPMSLHLCIISVQFPSQTTHWTMSCLVGRWAKSLLFFFHHPGTCGKCIRTETSWVTPVAFVEEALGQTDTAWRRDILWEGKPILELITVTVYATIASNCFYN